MSGATLRELHDSLLLTFSAHAPTIVNLFHQTAPAPAGFAAGLKPGGAGGGATVSVPEALAAQWRGRALPSRHRGLGPAVYMLGGPDVLLYLFARVSPLSLRRGRIAARAVLPWRRPTTLSICLDIKELYVGRIFGCFNT